MPAANQLFVLGAQLLVRDAQLLDQSQQLGFALVGEGLCVTVASLVALHRGTHLPRKIAEVGTSWPPWVRHLRLNPLYSLPQTTDTQLQGRIGPKSDATGGRTGNREERH